MFHSTYNEQFQKQVNSDNHVQWYRQQQKQQQNMKLTTQKPE